MKVKKPKKRIKIKFKKTASRKPVVKKKIKKVKLPKRVLIKKRKKPKKSLNKSKKSKAIKKKSFRKTKKRKKVIASNVKKVVAKKRVIKKARKKIIKKTVNKIVKKAKKVILRKKIRVINPVKKETEALFRAKIKVVGIGGGGGSIVSEIGRSLNKASFVIADTDIRALKKKSGIKYFWFGEEFTHGLGTGVNPEIAREAAESEKEKIADLFKDQDIVILIASLGGGLGSGATQVFAQAAKSFGGITLGIFTLPFRFEGKNKSRIAQKALKELKNSLNVSITIPNERIFKIIDSNTSITEAFSTVNKNLIESLESLIDLIYNPGLINIDFADLRTILNGNGNFAFLNTVQATGKDRAEETVQKIFINPLYQNNNFIAEKILFNISGGANLNMFEVEKISKSIAELNPKAKIIFGISKNIKAKNKIKTTLLMTGPGKVTEKIKEVIVVKKITPVLIKKKKPTKILSDSNLVLPPQRDPALAGETTSKLSIHGTIRRNALEIKKAEAIEQDKRLLQEEEWEVPAFLRRVKPSIK